MPTTPREPRPRSEADALTELVGERIRSYVADPERRTDDSDRARALLPDEVVERLNILATTSDLSYRDGIMTILALPLVRGSVTDVTIRSPGLRSAGDRVAQMLPGLHIRGSKGPFQVIGKNTSVLVRGNYPAWDWTLRWASGQVAEVTVDLAKLESAFTLVVAAVAAQARAVLPMPTVRPQQLTHQRCMSLVDELFRQHSEGSYEQFTIAALLHALVEQERGPGRGGSRIETKGINEADAARGQSDIEVRQGQRVVEGIEVSANPWQQKVLQAKAAIEAGLSRAHVVAAVGSDDYRGVEGFELFADGQDVSILDLRAVAAVVLAILDKPHREVALTQLYTYLVRHTRGIDAVNRYVRLLKERELAVEAG